MSGGPIRRGSRTKISEKNNVLYDTTISKSQPKLKFHALPRDYGKKRPSDIQNNEREGVNFNYELKKKGRSIYSRK